MLLTINGGAGGFVGGMDAVRTRQVSWRPHCLRDGEGLHIKNSNGESIGQKKDEVMVTPFTFIFRERCSV